MTGFATSLDLRACYLERVRYEFEAPLFPWASNEKFFLISLPLDASEEIREISHGLTIGFGSVRVDVTVGVSKWRTSVFPNAANRRFELPIKAEVRKANALATGSIVRASVELVDF